MQIILNHCVIRPLRLDDAASLARFANNYRVWRNMRDLFPHPYSETDAVQFIGRVTSESPESVFAIEVGGEAVGTIGLRRRDDIERFSAELGYWLGEPFWGCGLMTEVVRAFVPVALREFKLLRIEAWVFEWNPASARVLEKVGFKREGVMLRSAIKDGQVINRWLYAHLAEEPSAQATSSGNNAPELAPVRD